MKKQIQKEIKNYLNRLEALNEKNDPKKGGILMPDKPDVTKDQQRADAWMLIQTALGALQNIADLEFSEIRNKAAIRDMAEKTKKE